MNNPIEILHLDAFRSFGDHNEELPFHTWALRGESLSVTGSMHGEDRRCGRAVEARDSTTRKSGFNGKKSLRIARKRAILETPKLYYTISSLGNHECSKYQYLDYHRWAIHPKLPREAQMLVN